MKREDRATGVDRFRGCQYYTRCPIRIYRCMKEDPNLLEIVSDGGNRFLACHVRTKNEQLTA